MTEDKIKLILKVAKPIWLNTSDREKYQILEWTTIKPPKDVGHIDKDSLLIFNRMSPYRVENLQPLEFLVVVPGPVDGSTADFFEGEIDNLTKEGALVLMGTHDIDEATITLDEICIKYPKDPSFDSPVLLPRDLYVIMTLRESGISAGKIIAGEKVSLKRLIDIYSTAVGKGLILKSTAEVESYIR